MHFSKVLLAALPVTVLALPAANDLPVLTVPAGKQAGPGSPGNGGGSNSGGNGGGHNSPHPTTTTTSKGGNGGGHATSTKTTSTSTKITTSSTTTSTTSSTTSSTSSSSSSSSTTSTTLTSSSTTTSSTTSTAPAPTNSSPSGSAPPPSGVTFQGIAYAGSGCNAGSVAGTISSDLTTVTLLYDSFIAQAGSGIAPAEARKNCQLNLQLGLPQGWQFSVFKADYRGYAFLSGSGDKGVIKATYYFSGDSTQAASELDLLGPFDDNYLKTDEFGLESTVWSPCGEQGLLNINSEVRVTPLNTNNTALLTVDSTDLAFETVHYLQWQAC